MKKLIKCPVCGCFLRQREIIEDDILSYKCQRLINHYRHRHISWYNGFWNRIEIESGIKTEKYVKVKKYANKKAIEELLKLPLDRQIIEKLSQF